MRCWLETARQEQRILFWGKKDTDLRTIVRRGSSLVVVKLLKPAACMVVEQNHTSIADEIVLHATVGLTPQLSVVRSRNSEGRCTGSTSDESGVSNRSLEGCNG